MMKSENGINWLYITKPGFIGNQDWKSVCWSSQLGKFVAVATSGTYRVMWSTDGQNWTVTTDGSLDKEWNSVCWSPELGIFVAVGHSEVMTSLNGENWTAVTLTNNNIWKGVCWSAELGLFVAVSSNGTGNKVMTSVDGVTWALQATPSIINDSTWEAVCWSYQLGILVAVASSGVNRVMISLDGTTWTVVFPNFSHNWNAVTWSPELGIFVAVGLNAIMSSVDGLHWQDQSAGINDNLTDIVWSSELGMFVVVNNTSVSNQVLTSSLQGRSLTSYNVFDNPFNSIDSNGTWSIQQVCKKGVYTLGDTTFSVLGTNYVFISNTAPVTITNFLNGTEGQMLTLVFADDKTTLNSNVNLRLSTSFTSSTNATLMFIYNGTVWCELTRSVNTFSTSVLIQGFNQANTLIIGQTTVATLTFETNLTFDANTMVTLSNATSSVWSMVGGDLKIWSATITPNNGTAGNVTLTVNSWTDDAGRVGPTTSSTQPFDTIVPTVDILGLGQQGLQPGDYIACSIIFNSPLNAIYSSIMDIIQTDGNLLSVDGGGTEWNFHFQIITSFYFTVNSWLNAVGNTGASVTAYQYA